MSFSRATKRRTKKHDGVASVQEAEKILAAGKIVDDQLYQTVKTTFQAALPKVRAEVMPTVIANMLLVSLWIMHEDYGFGYKRLKNFLSSMFKVQDCLQEPEKYELTMADLNHKLIEECKFDTCKEIAAYEVAEEKAIKERTALYSAVQCITDRYLTVTEATNLMTVQKAVAREAWKQDKYAPAKLTVTGNTIVDQDGNVYLFTSDDLTTTDWYVVNEEEQK